MCTSDFYSSIIHAMKSSNVPSAAMLIISDRQIKLTKVYGLADPQTGREVTPDTLFTIASISKTVTATALMTLYEQEKFSLDDNIDRYLPFGIRNPLFPDIPITFRMLLTHTSTIHDSDVIYEYYTLEKKPVLPDSPIPLGNFLKNYLSVDGKLYSQEDNFIKEVPPLMDNYYCARKLSERCWHFKVSREWSQGKLSDWHGTLMVTFIIITDAILASVP